MFQKDGSSTIGGKKDVPLRKSDRRRLRDRALDALFVGSDGAGGGGGSAEPCDWIARADKLVDDAVVAPKGGDVLSRKLKLPGGEHATLFLRAPSASGDVPGSSGSDGTSTRDELIRSYPAAWPYRRSTQPILLEYEDADRKVHLAPLLPLLAALPPPLLTPPLANDDGSDNERRYRIPNVTVHPEVSKYICRGADLMKSGMRSFPPPWTLRQSKGLVTISVIGNPQPLAVGTIENSLFREYCYSKNGKQGRGDWKDAAANLVGPGKKGVGVAVFSCYGDDLWEGGLPPKHKISGQTSDLMDGVSNPLGGGVYDDGNWGNAGFVEGKHAWPILDVGEDKDNDEEEEEDVEDERDEGKEEAEDASADLSRLDLSECNKEQSTTETSDEPPDQTENNNGEDNGKNGNDAIEEALPDHNEILLNAFYASLLLLLSSKTALPLPVSTYYAKYLLASVPSSGPRLDMKQTTHKKIGPFLLDMDANGVIKVGASKDKKDRCAFLVGIVKNHPDLIRFKREWKNDIGVSGGVWSAAGTASQKTKLAVVDLFIVPRHISDGLQLDKDAVMAVNAKTEERKGTGFLTKTECRALIENYVETEQLADPNSKGRVLVNGPLCDALYRKSKKNKKPGQSTDYPTSVKRKDLIERWIESMEKGHAVVQMPGSKIVRLGRGGPKTVDVEVEFRQGNRKKFLTRVRGMEEYGIDSEALSQDVARRFACSSAAETDPVGRPALKKGRVELIMQGHLSEELTALLTGDEKLSSHGGAKGGDYNLPKSVINVALRKGVPARKKR
ncbi:hypothetical protein ACHAWF_005997 [Thalassiosira exigua]